MRLSAHDQLALVAAAARPAREARRHDLLGQLIELGAARFQRAFEFGARVEQRLAADARVEEVRGLGQRRARQSGGNRQDAVFHLPVFGDHHDQRALRLEPHEFDMLEPHIELGGEHDAGGAGQSGQKARGLREHIFNRGSGRRHLPFDRAAVVLVQVADLHQRIDEEAQAHFGRQPSGRGMRRIDQAELLEIRHHVADRGRRQRHLQDARDIARADRLAGREIALDDLAENLARPVAQLGERDLRGADRDIV